MAIPPNPELATALRQIDIPPTFAKFQELRDCMQSFDPPTPLRSQLSKDQAQGKW